MFRKSIRFTLIFFAITISWQLIAHQEVKWNEVLGICMLMFLFDLLYSWTEVPYQWNKEKNNK